MLKFFNAIILYELKLAFRAPRDIFHPLLFFLVIISLFPLAITPNSEFLIKIGAGVIWVAALLATLLALDRLFRTDYEDGTLEQMLLSSNPLPIYVLAKILVHWLVTGLPLVIISPLLALMLHLPFSAMGILVLTLLLGTPILSFLGSIVLALTMGLNQRGVLLSILLLPLYVPVLVFGAGTVVTSLQGMMVTGELLLLGSYLLLALTLTPFITAAALRVGVTI